MAYLALYRRFRPQVFEDVIGQETAITALVNQIKTDKVAHAYLFCGARGTGKTTVAKIFARAINCELHQGSPCGKCPTCLALESGSSMDIIEMDAASNNKVDNAREIRDKVQYPPVNGKYKVYIIDEVHMLTIDAFNALLKTIEEPPAHAVFILATTEPHKIPATILSRCMRFDFKLVALERIAQHVRSIYDQLGKEYETDAINLIARAGEGSVRDALSVADTCLSFKPGKLTYADVVEVLGASNRQTTAKLVGALINQNAGEALLVIDELISLGKNVDMLTKDILSYLRDLMVVKSCNNPVNVLKLPAEEVDALKSIASGIDSHGLLRIVEVISKIETDVKYSTHARIILETAIVKCAQSASDYNLDALLSRISRLEEQLANGVKVQVEAVSAPAEQVAKKVKSQPLTQVESASQTVAKLSQTVEFAKPVETPSTHATEKPTQPQSEQSAQTVERFVAESPKVEVLQDNRPESPLSGQVKPQPQAVQTADNTAKTYTSTVPDRRIWGTLVKSLRETRNTMLWVICQELRPQVVNGVITVDVETDSEYVSLTKSENLAKLKEMLSAICNYEVVIKKQGEVKQTYEDDIKKVQVDFDKVDVIE